MLRLGPFLASDSDIKKAPGLVAVFSLSTAGR